MSTRSINSQISEKEEKFEYEKIKIPFENALREQLKACKDEDMKNILTFPKDNITIVEKKKEEIKELSVNK